tara:strand:- start:752 stop:1144 length:393 start_codon:yes stop_codon:yes gene_type:complete
MDKQEIEELLQQFTQEEIRDAISSSSKNKKRRRGKGKRKKNSSPKTQSQSSGNKFDDMMSNISLSSEESKELKEAAKSDSMANQTQNKGKRPEVKKISVRCTACNKDYKMFPSQIYNRERWKCNKCITGR